MGQPSQVKAETDRAAVGGGMSLDRESGSRNYGALYLRLLDSIRDLDRDKCSQASRPECATLCVSRANGSWCL